ncbi:MAG: hypothetical protein WBV82_25210 [Myxococcaceae bacterium]
MTRVRWATAMAVACAWSSVAYAHELECKKTVNGYSVYEVAGYPTTLHYELEVHNIHPSLPSKVLELEDPLLEERGFRFNPDVEYELPVHGKQTYAYDVVLDSVEKCMQLAANDGTPDEFIDSALKVGWDLGEHQCSARVACAKLPPFCGPTRSLGFFKVHLKALEACIDQGEIDLGPGFTKITSLEKALGLLWASPEQTASDLEKARLLLARQTLVAHCNDKLFGIASDKIDEANAALKDKVCTDMAALADELDAFNRSGETQPYPPGFDPGDAKPKQASDMARGNDPTVKSSDVCKAK